MSLEIYRQNIRELIDSIKENKNPYLVCPYCKRGKLEDKGVYWQCNFRDCFQRIKNIPSTSELKEMFILKERLEFMKEWKI